MYVLQPTRYETIVQKSRFIAIVEKTDTIEEANTFISRIQKEYSDASHVCSAIYINDGQIMRSNDNHEPSGTAGMPMLMVLKESGFTNISACVVRYFGGIKLGASNLTRTYRSTLASCLALTPIAIPITKAIYTITFDYNLQASLTPWLYQEVEILDTLYDEAIHMRIATTKKDFTTTLQERSGGKATARFLRNEVSLVAKEDVKV